AIGEVHEEYFIRGTVRPYDCRDYAFRYGDSLYHDSLAYGQDDSWWRRLRSRLFDDEEALGDTLRGPETGDTARLGPEPPDTARPEPLGRDAGRDTTRHDTIILETPPPARPDTTFRDTVLRDTTPPDTTPPDTSGVRRRG
ncbi:MAG: hypothetical protein GWM90_09595, partial [Gemmatimonadetes bacterium]|nr:hypothetical protein [Gemmatimonadota bacterium]NIR36508.1 hypothetical protein [Actinomycetota bacterium]NIU74350.1 hypothetical protein [Gammaproteobacteria bacterium]NIQ54156.1 hypothetical protein [Gemmatimonadota bacterium]NIX44357.1 hypothetical protein [Gemmatimonadota bacterium]